MQKKKVYGIIYKAETKHGSKVYIGQTIKPLEIRRKQHTKLNKIMPNWEIIDTAYSREELDNKEKQWIDHYDSMNPEKGFNRQYGKGKWSKQAITDKRIKCNSNKEWFNDLSICNPDYFYSIDIDGINRYIKEYIGEDCILTKPQLCILKFLTNIIFKDNKKYKIGNKTFLISFIQILKELPYLKNYPHIENQYYNLTNNMELFDFIKSKSIFLESKNENDWVKNYFAFSFAPGVIKKYRRVHEIDCELDKDDFDDGYLDE
jgi:hypothetical protein